MSVLFQYANEANKEYKIKKIDAECVVTSVQLLIVSSKEEYQKAFDVLSEIVRKNVETTLKRVSHYEIQDKK